MQVYAKNVEKRIFKGYSTALFSKSEDFNTCLLFITNKVACRSDNLRYIVCRGPQTASADIFVKNSRAGAVNEDWSDVTIRVNS